MQQYHRARGSDPQIIIDWLIDWCCYVIEGSHHPLIPRTPKERKKHHGFARASPCEGHVIIAPISQLVGSILFGSILAFLDWVHFSSSEFWTPHKYSDGWNILHIFKSHNVVEYFCFFCCHKLRWSLSKPSSFRAKTNPNIIIKFSNECP